MTDSPPSPAPAQGPRCSRCGGPMVQHSPLLLVLVGLVILVIAAAMPWYERWLLFPAIFLALVAGFLLLWGLVARGRWCRQCKSF